MGEVLAPPTSHPNDKCATPSNAGSDTSRTLRPNASPGQTKPPYHVFTRPPHTVPAQTECALRLVGSAFHAQNSAVNL